MKKQREVERREREMYEDEEWIEEVESRPRRYAPPPEAPAPTPAPAPKPGRLRGLPYMTSAQRGEGGG